jgi:uridine phosphorylase
MSSVRNISARGGELADEVVIEPRRGRGEPLVPPGIVMAFTPVDLALIRNGLGLAEKPDRRVDFAKLWACSSPWEKVGFAGPALGAPAAVMLLERLIALGARAVVGVGSCGSLQFEAPIGRVILPDSARVEEGTSSHYLGPGVCTMPDPDLVGALRGALLGDQLAPLEGRIWTIDAPFRETKRKVMAYREEGILGVDMEASALMTAASFRKIPFASLLVVSDEIGSLTWKRGFGEPVYRETLARAARVAVQVLAALGPG